VKENTSNNFSDFLNRIQGIENIKIAEENVQKIKIYVDKKKIDKNELNYKQMLEILK
jgi:hypothetical protein